MKRILLGALTLICTSNLLLGCSEIINSDYTSSDKDGVLISIEKNVCFGANQDIKVITFGEEKLENYSIQKNDDGTKDVILHLSTNTNKYRKEENK